VLNYYTQHVPGWSPALNVTSTTSNQLHPGVKLKIST